MRSRRVAHTSRVSRCARPGIADFTFQTVAATNRRRERKSRSVGGRTLRAFYQRLLARGKTKMQALVAVMRKLLHAIFGMFKHNQTFDGHKVYALVPAATPTPVAQEAA